MPLRSVEAATRDDAIAAAREQFGPSARVVGVRRVRSGGVLGFFATERYVAEVANDASGRPAVPAPASGRSVTADDDDAPSPGYTSSPLSAAAAATAAPSSAAVSGARAAAPPRNAAAAWAAAAGTTDPARPSSSSSSSSFRADDDRLDELAGLLGGEPTPAAPVAPVYGRSSLPRPATPRTSGFPAAPSAFPSVSPISFPVASPAVEDDDPFVEHYVAGRPVLRAEDTSSGPSPFTAALARMVSGDRDVREAVEHALEKPAVKRPWSDAEAWSSRPGSLRSEDTSVPSPAARQEEETVGDQVIAPPFTLTPETTELPNWAVEPEASGGSPREEAIAEVLRSALAQGHSDEALAGILRKVLAGEPPQAALSEPVSAPETVQFAVPEVAAVTELEFVPPATMSLAMALAGTTVREPEPVVEVAPAPVVEAPVYEEPVAAVVEEIPAEPLSPASDASLFETPAEIADYDAAEFETQAHETGFVEAVEPEVSDEPAVEVSRYTAPSYRTPSYLAPSFSVPGFELPPVLSTPSSSSYAPSTSIWGTVTDSIWGGAGIDSIWGGTGSEIPLWGDAGSKPTPPVSTSDVPIWDDVEDLPVFDTMTMPAAATTAEDTVEVVAEQVAEPVAEVAEAEAEVAVVAAVLMRTASDPAPMSLDATTVMPPLSLLPPLPGSRSGRSGRPPVPPSTPRPQMPLVTPPAPSGPGDSRPSATGPADGGVPTSPLATVTRLHLAPPMATPEAPDSPETPELPDMFAEIPVDEPAAAEPTLQEPVADESVMVEDVATVDSLSEAETSEDLLAEPAVAEPTTIEATVVEPILAEPILAEPILAEPIVAETAPVDVVADEETAPEIVPTELGSVAAQLEKLGVPGHLLGSGFSAEVATHGTYRALTRALALRLPKAPELPTGAGEVLFVVGPGVETLRAARALAGSLRLDPDRVLWATRGDLAGLAPKSSRVNTVDAAMDRQLDVAHAGSVTIVAVDAPMRSDAYWMAQMLTIWSPVAVWAVVEATRKPEDLGPWIDGLPRVDALMVQDTDLSADPAAVLRQVANPVAYLDGVRATPHRWASLLCERLEGHQA